MEQFSESTVKVFLKNMELDVRIGLHDHEIGRTQRVHVSVELYACCKTYLNNATRESIIDYSHIYEALKSWAQRPHVLLIETYISDLMAICFADQRVQAVRVAITKPDIFPEAETAGVAVFMHRADWEPSA